MKTSNDPPVTLATSAAADWSIIQCQFHSEDDVKSLHEESPVDPGHPQ